MVYTETVTINGREFRHTWSDSGTVLRDGVEYDEAYDPADVERTYTEGPAKELSAEETLDVLLGGA